MAQQETWEEWSQQPAGRTHTSCTKTDSKLQLDHVCCVFLFLCGPQSLIFCLGLSKGQLFTACPFNCNAYAPWSIRSYINSLILESTVHFECWVKREYIILLSKMFFSEIVFCLLYAIHKTAFAFSHTSFHPILFYFHSIFIWILNFKAASAWVPGFWMEIVLNIRNNFLLK